jgi:hypothetical protein
MVQQSRIRRRLRCTIRASGGLFSRTGGELIAGRDDGFDNVCIARTAANLPAQLVADGLRVGAGVPLQYVARHDQHAGRAESALQSVTFMEVTAQ